MPRKPREKIADTINGRTIYVTRKYELTVNHPKCFETKEEMEEDLNRAIIRMRQLFAEAAKRKKKATSAV